ncbi:MAG: CHC2 zinc finger domain-containing protein, partial [Candidatus Poribacteria bacterium]|nr:CHC2 zinc finger domain-containing protein [Candidatus Poribacteria bacterium]
MMDQHFDTDVIKSSIDIVFLISNDESLEKSGDTYRSGHESSHSSKSGTCLDVCPLKQVYLCRNCGESGDIFSWVMHRDSCSFIDAAKWLCETYHI